jgi:hypothetical protein
MDEASQEIVKLRESAIDEAKRKGIRDIERFSRFVMSLDDPDILREIIGKLSSLEKWYDMIVITTNPNGKQIVDMHRKNAYEIGVPLEDLVNIALEKLGCKVESGVEIWTFGDFPTFEEEGEFSNREIVFKRLLNKKDAPDFVSRDIAIEVKNRDPDVQYRTFDLFKRDVLDRFKNVKKKKRYLLIPEGVLSEKQQEILRLRKINEVNLSQQLRVNNEKEVYRDVFYALRQVLSTLP